MPHPPEKAESEPVKEKPVTNESEVTVQSTVQKNLPDIPLEELKEKILTAVRRESISIAAGLEKAEKWKIQDNTITLVFNSPFAGSLVKKEFRTIQNIIKDKLTWNVSFTAAVNKVEKSDDPALEEQVELVRSVFRGTIVKK